MTTPSMNRLEKSSFPLVHEENSKTIIGEIIPCILIIYSPKNILGLSGPSRYEVPNCSINMLHEGSS